MSRHTRHRDRHWIGRLSVRAGRVVLLGAAAALLWALAPGVVQAQPGLCLASVDGQTCQGQCPGPLPCQPKRIRYNIQTGTYHIVECDCAAGCHVEIPASGGPPVCVGQCTDPNQNCHLVVVPIDPPVYEYFCTCYKNWVIADDFVIAQQPVPPLVNRVRWWGSYLDPDFEPTPTAPPLRPIDGWLVAIHSDIPAQPCPVLPGTIPFDFCGDVSFSPNCPPSNVLFTPLGGITTYQLIGYAGAIPARVRICGVIQPNCTAPCATACVQVVSVLPCDTAVSRPDQLLLQWAFPPNVVPETDTGASGCDQHRVFGYVADLANGCVQHVADATLLGPNGSFRPVPGVTYWISIQAEIGKQYVPFFCDTFNTGQAATRDFWGWHTTPPGYHNLDDAFMGMLRMDCFGSWLYNWMNHLHWSDAPYQPCADDPTKSIDMAFCLSNVIAGGPEQTLWCQPPNPGPPAPVPPPPVRTFPPGSIDTFPATTAAVTVQFINPPLGFFTVNLSGPTVVARKNPVPVGPLDVVDTEMISMNLTGVSPGGPMTLFEDAALASVGKTTGNAGNDFPTVDSFFDVFVNIDLPGVGIFLKSQGAVHVVSTAPLWELPPANATYSLPPAFAPVPLEDRFVPGLVRALLFRVDHNTGVYRGGIDIHSDTDFLQIPTVCVCHGDMNNNGRVNGDDIQQFVRCYLALACPPIGGCPVLVCPCVCADMNDDGALNPTDITLFIKKLLLDTDTLCP
ncbi:MAG: hypothetical protein U1A27_14045 [Phycisphaerae bacterium]